MARYAVLAGIMLHPVIDESIVDCIRRIVQVLRMAIRALDDGCGMSQRAWRGCVCILYAFLYTVAVRTGEVIMDITCMKLYRDIPVTFCALLLGEVIIRVIVCMLAAK